MFLLFVDRTKARPTVPVLSNPKHWQLSRMLCIANRANRDIASVAFGFGMTVTHFKSLPPDKQREAREASLRLCAADNCG
jgi:hypothetical protein